MDVDWAAMFRSFYVEVKLLIACKDSSKIPLQRIVEMNQELYLLHLLVAGLGGGQSDGDDPSDNPAADQRLSDDAANNNMDLETRDPPSQSPGVHPGNNSSYSSLPGTKSAAAGAVDCEAGQKSVHASPTLSLPGRLNYDVLDDGDWDQLDAPMHIDVDDVEENAICHLGEKSANLSYCSQLLAVVNNEDSDEEEMGLGVSAEDSHLACLDKKVCDKLSGLRGPCFLSWMRSLGRKMYLIYPSWRFRSRRNKNGALWLQ
jgi:hypothetical protein